MKSQNEFFKCQCGCQMLEIEFDKEFGQYNLAIWTYGRQSIIPFLDRFRWIWRILITGNPWADSVILDKKQVDKLSEFIDDINLENKSTVGQKISRKQTIKLCNKIRRDAEKSRKNTN